MQFENIRAKSPIPVLIGSWLSCMLSYNLVFWKAGLSFLRALPPSIALTHIQSLGPPRIGYTMPQVHDNGFVKQIRILLESFNLRRLRMTLTGTIQ
jgi:hypothetical protein